MDEKTKEGLAGFGYLFLVVIDIVISLLLNGWALSVLWGWFVASLLGVGELTFANALGLSLFTRMLSGFEREAKDQSEKSEVQKKLEDIFNHLSYPVLCVGFGFVFHLMMRG